MYSESKIHTTRFTDSASCHPSVAKTQSANQERRLAQASTMTNNPAPPQVRFGDWISEGWKMFTEQWKGWVSLSLGFFLAVVVPLVAFILVMYAMIFATMTAPGPRGAPPQVPMMTILFLYLGMFALILVLMPFTVLLTGGAYRAAFKQLRGGRVEFRDLFSARDCYWRLLGA